MTQITRRDALKAGGATLAAATLVGSGLASAATSTARRQSILITGCSSGFGHMSAIALARAGHEVIATMRRMASTNSVAAAELSAVAEAEGLSMMVAEIDVTDDTSVSTAVDAALGRFGHIDVVVNNAGIGIAGPSELQPLTSYTENIDTNLLGSLRVVQAVAPSMRARREGLIVQVSSALGRTLLPGAAGYCASKAAVEATFEIIAYEMAMFGIEVSIVQPSNYPTEFQSNGRRYFEEMLETVSATRPELLEVYAPLIAAIRAGLQASDEDPMDVVNAIIGLIEAERGERPLRTVVSPNPQGVEGLNAAAASLQSQLLQAMGLSEFVSLRL